MEGTCLEKIPALVTWKMLSNTIQVMHNMGSSEKGFERLSRMIEKPELSAMFVFAIPNLSFEEHNLLNQKLKEFTIWVLGQFFYLSSSPNFNRVQKSLVNVQNRILHQMQYSIYYDLITEYIKVLEQLNIFVNNNYEGTVELKAFLHEVPEDLSKALNLKPLNIKVYEKTNCLNMQDVVLQILAPSTIHMFNLFHFTDSTNELMKHLLFVLKRSNLKLKIAVLKIYKSLQPHYKHPVHIENIKNEMFSVFESLFLFTFSMKNDDFNEISLDLFDVYKTNEKCQRLYEYILSDNNAPAKFHKVAVQYVNICKLDKDLNYMACFKEKMINEVQQYKTTEVYDAIYALVRIKLLDINNKDEECKLDNLLEKLEIFLENIICVKYSTDFILLDESEFVNLFIKNVSSHLKHCNCNINYDKFINVMSLVVALGNSKYSRMVFQWYAYLLNKNCVNSPGNEIDVQIILEHFKNKCISRSQVFDSWCYYMLILTVSSEESYEEFEKYFLKVAVSIMEETHSECQQTLMKYLVLLLSGTKRVDEYMMRLLTPAMISDSIAVKKEFFKSLPQLFTILCGRFEKLIYFKCLKVNMDLVEVGSDRKNMYLYQIHDALIEDPNSPHVLKFIKYAFRLLQENYEGTDDECRILVIKTLPILSKLVPKFPLIVVQKWMESIESKSICVRNALINVIFDVISSPLNNPNIQDSQKQTFLDSFIDLISEATFKSLQLRTHLYMQETTFFIIEAMLSINYKGIELKMLQLLLYFIIMVTSNVTYRALTALISYSKQTGTTTGKLFTKYRPEMCKVIVHLCAINHTVANLKLSVSLDSFSAELGYCNVKHLFLEETRYLLPYFVSLYFKRPDVEQLIEEIAMYNEITVKELFAEKYGYIYVHLTLNANDKECQSCLRFVERKTTDSDINLRKNNFMIILNELLLNFYEKRERVLACLSILASEESNGSETSVQEYIWPRFLGVLQYLDLKLFSSYHNKANMLQSLVAIFKYMGPKYVTPVRFKIIAMLRTVFSKTKGKFPDLNCSVWQEFIKSCDLEVLGPQLATICVSIYPLMETNESKINEILKYLIVTNESLLTDNIVDLYFLLELHVDPSIHEVIRRHLEKVQELSFEQHLEFFMKYLCYETIEVQLHALKYIKKLLNKNRFELERMILGFNGIDTRIVELINYLMQGCREYDQKLQFACGDCIGELGAIEPSHLPPPRSIQEEEEFNFFITEPKFILNSLNRFARAMQIEANCQKMDTFALAIQETLRTYDISPNSTTDHHKLWSSLSNSQKELMLPFISSKYCNVSNTEILQVGPIYGSNLGSNFKSWLDNWTNKLISSIKTNKKALLCSYIPSMKQDIKTLMFFLPHIFLNSLIEGGSSSNEEAYKEFMAIIDPKNESVFDEHIKNNRPQRTDSFVLVDQNKRMTQTFHKEDYLKVVFVLFDFIERWMREWIWEKGYAGQDNSDYQTIKRFSCKFSKYQLARSNFNFGGYPRALMYLEDHIMADKDNQNNYLSLLSEIYFRLNEADGVAGAAALRKSEATLEQRILDHEVAGQIPLAAVERLTLNFPQLQGLVKAQLDLDHATSSLYIAKGVWDEQPGESTSDWMLEAQAEPLWRLGRYDELDDLLKRHNLENSKNWGVHAGLALIHFRNGHRSEFNQQLEMLKTIQVNHLGASSLEEGTYQHGYYYVARLHAINELEQIENAVGEVLLRPNDSMVTQSILNKINNEWEMRLKIVQQSVKVIEPILCLRRAALEIARTKVESKSVQSVPLINSFLGNTWLKSAVIAMNSEVHKQAYSYLLKAEEFAPPRLFIEKAKWFWLCNEHEQALSTLQRQLRIILPAGKISDDFPIEKRKLCAEAKLHIASYNDTISNVDIDVNIQHYKESIDMFRECEKSLVSLAQYYDRVFQNLSDDDKDIRGSDIQIHMINNFGKSLQYGTEYIYQSMPRLLSIWFDYGTRLLDITTPSLKEERKQNLLKMTKLIDNFLERLPPFIFLTAFSQIISRICHSQKEIYKELNLIIAKLILKYPQQTLWMMISVIKSSYELRSRRCKEILSDSRLQNHVMITFLGDFIQLAEKLIDLTNKDIATNVSTISVSSILRALPRLLQQKDFSEIMIPTHKFRKLILPNQENLNMSYNPFPNHYVYIIGIEDEMTILPSLQRPRRITLRGSDGKGYIQMLKPKDDLRKDFRLMEFNDIVNQLLSQETESRQRRLNIRLYSVAPLNEECGMIEWVPNLVGLRPTLMTIYKQRGLGMKQRELKDRCAKQTDPLDKKKRIYNEVLLPKHPPVLGDWFRRTFPDAHGWFTARTSYTRTTAVMSMVGHILGLGDRHGENILLDSTCGDAVHVDFNCLFNKGEQFEWPERVPFRLTPNMVAAMGPLGVEGMFRKSCACTLHVLRTHVNTLMSIVTPFVYDPLVSWPKRPTSANTTTSERMNELAVEHIKVIQRRLQGQVKGIKSKTYSISLSVEGQTNKLIADAMSIDNLCQMYIGWGPYL